MAASPPPAAPVEVKFGPPKPAEGPELAANADGAGAHAPPTALLPPKPSPKPPPKSTVAAEEGAGRGAAGAAGGGGAVATAAFIVGLAPPAVANGGKPPLKEAPRPNELSNMLSSTEMPRERPAEAMSAPSPMAPPATPLPPIAPTPPKLSAEGPLELNTASKQPPAPPAPLPPPSAPKAAPPPNALASAPPPPNPPTAEPNERLPPPKAPPPSPPPSFAPGPWPATPAPPAAGRSAGLPKAASAAPPNPFREVAKLATSTLSDPIHACEGNMSKRAAVSSTKSFAFPSGTVEFGLLVTYDSRSPECCCVAKAHHRRRGARGWEETFIGHGGWRRGSNSWLKCRPTHRRLR